jgi:hypothetical protein
MQYPFDIFNASLTKEFGGFGRAPYMECLTRFIIIHGADRPGPMPHAWLT